MRLFLIALLSLSCFAGRPDDVHGWDRVNWNMTLAEVSAVYRPTEPATRSQYGINQPIPSVHVGEIVMRASVSTGASTENASQVVMLSVFGQPASDPRASASDFETLKSLLIEKYGHPTTEETHIERGVKSVTWIFPSTTINLEITGAESNHGYIVLIYSATDHKALDAL